MYPSKTTNSETFMGHIIETHQEGKKWYAVISIGITDHKVHGNFNTETEAYNQAIYLIASGLVK